MQAIYFLSGYVTSHYSYGEGESSVFVSDFPVTDSSLPNSTDGFVMKIDSTGAIIYSNLVTSMVGGYSRESCTGIAVDAAGNAHVIGDVDNTSQLISTDGTVITGHNDVFVAKYSSTGTRTFLGFLGGAWYDYPGAIALDNSGNVYVSGSTAGPPPGATNFPTTDGSVIPWYGSASFFTKYNSAGVMTFSTVTLPIVAPNYNSELIAVDNSGNLYFMGGTNIIVKVNSAGIVTSSFTVVTPPGYVYPMSLAVDGLGGLHMTGTTENDFFYSTDGSTYQGGSTASDLYVRKVLTIDPPVVTDLASNITQTSATLNSTVNPEGLATTVHYDYGTTTSYGTSVTFGSIGLRKHLL